MNKYKKMLIISIVLFFIGLFICSSDNGFIEIIGIIFMLTPIAAFFYIRKQTKDNNSNIKEISANRDEVTKDKVEYCPNCGKPVNSGSIYCINCGHKINQ